MKYLVWSIIAITLWEFFINWWLLTPQVYGWDFETNPEREFYVSSPVTTTIEAVSTSPFVVKMGTTDILSATQRPNPIEWPNNWYYKDGPKEIPSGKYTLLFKEGGKVTYFRFTAPNGGVEVSGKPVGITPLTHALPPTILALFVWGIGALVMRG